MRKLIERKLFPHVIKPGRYAGGEPGQIVKDPTGRVSYVHAYPDKYEIGQSYVGLQTLYHIVNQDDRFLCERVFSVDRDAESIMRREKIDLFSLESSRPIRDFAALGFTLVDELVYTNVLAMLDLSRIPLLSSERTKEHPLIIAGGPAVFNPEPLAPFVDVFFIGDGEEGLPEILSLLYEMPEATRPEKLRAIVEQVKSVYVPCFYDDEARPLVDFAPVTIHARLIPELKPEFYPSHPLVPLVETVHNHLGVEIMRGCPQGCKFCFAGPIYRPIRSRSVDEISQQVATQIKNTGYDEVTLLALSATDYPHLEELVTPLAKRLESSRTSITLPSLRPGSITGKLLDGIRRVRKSGLTIAPEAGSERLRLVIRKDFRDEAIYDTVKLALSKGWTSLKLYFMVGLPTETEDDLVGIANLVRNIRRIARESTQRCNITVALSPFVPKAHTPFQWDECEPEATVFEKIKFVKRQTQISGVTIKYNSTQLAMLACLLGRGGREMAAVIQTAFDKGCRFDSWSEEFAFDLWLEALKENGLDPAEGLRPIPFSQKLPWSHISKGPTVEHLIKQRKQSSEQLQDFVPHFEATTEVNADQSLQFGRGSKKVASRAGAAPTKNRVRLRWGKSDRYRYMSHLENLKLIERALRRAKWPVAYSQGFNPTMKLSLGPPLPHGFTSESEFIDITLETNLMPYMIENLKDSLPEGITIHDARTVLGKRASLNAVLNRANYRLPINAWETPEQLAQGISALMASKELPCERSSKKATRTIDIRPALYDLRLEADLLIMVLGLGEGGYAKPTEVAQLLVDGRTLAPSALPYHRLALYQIDADGNRIEAMDI